MNPAAAQTARKSKTHHGELRGLDRSPRSTMFEGRFGRLFRTLQPAEFRPADLSALAAKMVAVHEDQVTPETQPDAEENSGISAGYTYLGQFIDHDLTFDPVSSLDRQNDPDALVDFRTPRFDLDSVYGRGPDDQPYLYRGDGVTMLLGASLTPNRTDANPRDLPRNQHQTGEAARAVIGDPRNDENTIVSQLQAAMLRFHNRVLAFMSQHAAPSFEEAQQMVRWHYQWVVLNDFLPTIIGKKTLHSILPHIDRKSNVIKDPPQLKLYHPKNEAFIPVEFTVAAYRFGHSMVRPIYRLNLAKDRLPIFSQDGDSLVGFEALKADEAVDWSLFFKMGPAPRLGKDRLQPAYKIDSSLVDPLGTLPPAVVSSGPKSLAERNLLRGLSMGLPSGQAVAATLGIDPIPDKQLRVGKATKEDANANPLLTDISPAFRNNAPLWYYILAEAQQQFDGNDETPIHMGPVGGHIVGEVFVGLMMADSHSFLRQNPLFRPFDEFTNKGEFGMAELLKQAMQA